MQNALDDLTYDWITILHEKSKGLNAYEKYLQDAKNADSQECVDILQELYEQDSKMVQKVHSHVVEFMNQKSESEGRTSTQRESEVRAH